jgi:hypothetical protein
LDEIIGALRIPGQRARVSPQPWYLGLKQIVKVGHGCLSSERLTDEPTLRAIY